MLLLISALINSAHAQKYDFYEAAGVHNAPVIVFVHGGAWVSRDKSDYKSLGEALALKGVCAAIVNYGLAPITKHPEQIDQLDAMISDLKKKEIQELRCQPNLFNGSLCGCPHDRVLEY